MTAIDTVTERLRRLAGDAGIDRLSYFHCDHFEPWRHMDGRAALDPRNAEDTIAFVEAMNALPYARRLTLFMKSPFSARLVGQRKVKANPDDEIGFDPIRLSRQPGLVAAMRAIAASDHELQIHIHHERFTRNDWYSTSTERPENLKFRDFLTNRTTPEMDSARLMLYVRLTLQLFRKASGLPLKPWMFVHGMWSLNGSDRDFCCVDDELHQLRKLGLAGDFTFPAPRQHCNPAVPFPYLAKPVRVAKGYDHKRSRIEQAGGQAPGNKVFLWSTTVSARLCSLDTVSQSFAKLSQDPVDWAGRLLDGAVVHNGAVHVKTHAHSMMPAYFADAAAPRYPHAHPAVARLFEALMEGSARAGLAFELTTAAEIYNRFVGPNPPRESAPEPAIAIAPAA